MKAWNLVDQQLINNLEPMKTQCDWLSTKTRKRGIRDKIALPGANQIARINGDKKNNVINYNDG